MTHFKLKKKTDLKITVFSLVSQKLLVPTVAVKNFNKQDVRPTVKELANSVDVSSGLVHCVHVIKLAFVILNPETRK